MLEAKSSKKQIWVVSYTCQSNVRLHLGITYPRIFSPSSPSNYSPAKKQRAVPRSHCAKAGGGRQLLCGAQHRLTCPCLVAPQALQTSTMITRSKKWYEGMFLRYPFKMWRTGPQESGMQRVHLCQHFGCCQEGANLPIALHSPCFSLHCGARDDGCTPWGYANPQPCTSCASPWDLTWLVGNHPTGTCMVWMWTGGLTSTLTASHRLPTGIQPVLHLFKKEYTLGKQLAIWLFMTICAEKEDARIMRIGLKVIQQ